MVTAYRLTKLRRRNETAWGIHLSFLCPEVIEFCGLLGFDWVFLDAEHTPLNPYLCRELVCAADTVGLACLVRVARIDTAIIESYLDAGVLGVLAANVSSAVDAEALVSAVKFSPQGKRGAAAKTRAANYGLTCSPADYYRQANEMTFTVALLESQQGIDNLEAIAAVPGLDYLAIGPNDLGLSLGRDGGMADSVVRRLVEETQDRIRRAGKPQVTVVVNVEQARQAVTAGARLIAVPDTTLFAGAGRLFLQEIKN